MDLEKKHLLCTGCGACVSVCPNDSIFFKIDKEGFAYPFIDDKKCMHCGKCSRTCPLLIKNNETNVCGVIAAYNKNTTYREKSSSGGVFYLLTEFVLKNNGVVFGAIFNKDFNVVHSYIESLDDVSKMLGSKYVQSDIGSSFSDAKRFLEEGRIVLFSGTPCQIAGLMSYLGKSYEHLYTQEVVCHGVSSPLVWTKYIRALEKKYKSSVTAVSFRDKKKGWNEYGIRVKFENGKTYFKYHDVDLFMRGFIDGLFLRPSCYACAFKDKKCGDIILGDFWGIESIESSFSDNKGVSVVYIMDDKGNYLFDNISHKLTYKTIDVNVGSKYQTNLLQEKSVEKSQNRADFFKRINKLGILKNISSSLPNENKIIKIKVAIYRWLKSIGLK